MEPRGDSEPKVETLSRGIEDDPDLSNLTPMPKHVFLNTLPGHLAPFPTLPKSRYDADKSQTEFYGQESFLNAFITSHCRDYSGNSSGTSSVTNNTNVTVPTSTVVPDRPPSLMATAEKIVGGIGGKKNQCVECLRVFANTASLKQHERLHRGEKPYKCRFCNKTSATMCNIQTHERTHTRERPYKCTVCAADFGSSSNLKTHMRTHSGDRPFRCNLCDKRFVTSNALTTHLRAHWGLRLHPCPVCDRQFSTSSNLRVHHRTVHLRIKQYQCNVCGKSFATSSNLNAHSRQHPESAYRISYASTTYSNQTAATNHKLLAGEEVEENGRVVVLEDGGQEEQTMRLLLGPPPNLPPTHYHPQLHHPSFVPATTSTLQQLGVDPATTTLIPLATMMPSLNHHRKSAKVTVYCPPNARPSATAGGGGSLNQRRSDETTASAGGGGGGGDHVGGSGMPAPTDAMLASLPVSIADERSPNTPKGGPQEYEQDD